MSRRQTYLTFALENVLSLLFWTVNKPAFYSVVQGCALSRHPWKDSLEQNLSLSLLIRGAESWKALGELSPNNNHGMQTQTFRYNFTLVRWATWKHLQTLALGCGAARALLHCWWECQLLQALWRSVWQDRVRFTAQQVYLQIYTLEILLDMYIRRQD